MWTSEVCVSVRIVRCGQMRCVCEDCEVWTSEVCVCVRTVRCGQVRCV